MVFFQLQLWQIFRCVLRGWNDETTISDNTQILCNPITLIVSQGHDTHHCCKLAIIIIQMHFLLDSIISQNAPISFFKFIEFTNFILVSLSSSMVISASSNNKLNNFLLNGRPSCIHPRKPAIFIQPQRETAIFSPFIINIKSTTKINNVIMSNRFIIWYISCEKWDQHNKTKKLRIS